jgi:hypothetical protein
LLFYQQAMLFLKQGAVAAMRDCPMKIKHSLHPLTAHQ